MQKKFAAMFLGLTVLFSASACTPSQFKTWLDQHGFDSSAYSEEQLAQGADIATALWVRVIADAAAHSADAEYHKYDYVLSDASLLRLRTCESNGIYTIVSPGGAYRGAYQFSFSTWNAVAGRKFPALVGIDPARALPLHQDAMARALYLEMGRSPWPICGRYI